MNINQIYQSILNFIGATFPKLDPNLTFNITVIVIVILGLLPFIIKFYNRKNKKITIPGPPTKVVADRKKGEAIITFNSPVNDGGSPIIKYVVTSNIEGHTAVGNNSPIIITGLNDEKIYTFTVKAINSIGKSIASKPSTGWTPARVAAYKNGKKKKKRKK